ncbi:MAG TPA: sigma-70 family RNA polymerase sigma factor [Thermoanaerobaculia bacterium]|nr:sigma-70 family RNA polymerase sigma factor [Thermoanaerobaculia bacterium]
MAERESFEELALPLLDSLYRYARWLTKNVAEAEDLVQEAYLKGFRGYESFIAGSNIRAWMFRILRNTFLTSRTGLRAIPPVPLDENIVDSVVDPATPETNYVHRANADALRRAIDDLPVEFREVLLMCDVEGMRYKEIAEALSIPIGTVTSRLLRARARLRKALS